MSVVIAGKRVSVAGGYRKASRLRYRAANAEKQHRSDGAKRGWATWKKRAAKRLAEAK